MMRWRSEDYELLSVWHLPIQLRSMYMTSWLKVFVAPIKWLQAQILYKMQHDSRVIYLEKVLNEQMNIANYSPQNHNQTKQIYIEDAERAARDYIFLRTEQTPLYIFKRNENQPEYIGGNEVYNDFVVFIPEVLQSSEIKIKSLVNYYKLAGKKYEIQYY